MDIFGVGDIIPPTTKGCLVNQVSNSWYIISALKLLEIFVFVLKCLCELLALSSTVFVGASLIHLS